MFIYLQFSGVVSQYVKNAASILQKDAVESISNRLSILQETVISNTQPKLDKELNDAVGRFLGPVVRTQLTTVLSNQLSVITSLTKTQMVEFANQVPVGTIVAFGGNSTEVRSGWLPCTG